MPTTIVKHDGYSTASYMVVAGTIVKKNLVCLKNFYPRTKNFQPVPLHLHTLHVQAVIYS